MEKSKQQKNKVRFMVVRKFSGEKSMREAFEQLIDKITTYDEYLESDEMARKRQTYTVSTEEDD